MTAPFIPPRLPIGLPVCITERQADVLAYMGTGMSNREIGARLYITEDTVKAHVRHMLRKLKARNKEHALGLLLSGQAVIVRESNPIKGSAA